MKRYNFYLGIVISAGIAVIASLPKIFRSDIINWDNTINTIIYTFFYANLSWAVLTYFINNNLIKKRNNYRYLLGFLLIVSLGLASYVYDYIYSLFTANPFPLNDGNNNNNRNYMILLRGVIISCLYYFIVFYLYILEEKQKSSIEIEYLKQAQLTANLSSLKEQLSPHFLFNTLNTLASLTNEKNVKDYVGELANVYRYVLQFQEKDVVLLQQEIDFVISYLFIIKTRLENAIDFTIDIDEATMQSKLPPLTLQILVENAIKHNIAAEYKPLRLRIYNTYDNLIIIENNFQPKSSASNSTGTGLSNTLKRYLLLFDKKIEIENDEQYFRVKLPIIME